MLLSSLQKLKAGNQRSILDQVDRGERKQRVKHQRKDEGGEDELESGEEEGGEESSDGSEAPPVVKSVFKNFSVLSTVM